MQRCLASIAALLCAAFMLAWSSSAAAYPWMIRHEYGSCATCHTDPSGAGVLTEYGRAQSAILLSSRWGAAPDEEPGRVKDFVFGAVPTPEWLAMQGWIRNGYLWNDVDGHLVDSRFLQMRADLGAHVSLRALRAAATVGWNAASTAPLSERAWVTPASADGNVVSREHWIGASLAEDAVLLRAGRMNVPFGLRNIEHTSWVRSETRTDINQDQEHGVAVAYSGEKLRGELMGIAGNFQVSPDAYRERGYAGFVELSLAPRYALGLSSLVTHAAADAVTQKPTTRQAHGVFTRLAPSPAIALLGELDALFTSATGDPFATGYVGFVQADVEPIQGVHGIVTGEILERGGVGENANFGAWLSAAWFALPHVDARVDAIRRTAAGTPTTMTYLLQVHLYL